MQKCQSANSAKAKKIKASYGDVRNANEMRTRMKGK